MKVILAVSADNFVASGPEDKMQWTGTLDKKIFRLLTSGGYAPLFAGRKTWELMPQLPGRKVFCLSNTRGYSLDQAFAKYYDAWLIGGQTVVLEAIKKNMVSEIYLCRNDYVLGEGIKIHNDIEKFGYFYSNIKFTEANIASKVLIEIRKMQ